MTVVVGTAGHIDHGKTSLLRALTGIDADRLPEERARGMTLDIGYAHLALADGTELDFVDVPGHDRLVGNMLVGAGEIDAALLVVAADDGPRAQTMEHFGLLDALGIGVGLVAVTKVDLVSAERAAAVIADVECLVAGTTLAGSPVLRVAVTTGVGVDAVRAALSTVRDRALAAAGPAVEQPARLAIDRVFTIRGRGTVVTGTLRGGPIEPGASLRVVPDLSGRSIRVREVQVHGRAVEWAGPGRVALNVVAGDVTPLLARGVVLTADPAVVATDRLLVVLEPLTIIGRSAHEARAAARVLPADRMRVAVHLGAARVAATVGRSGRDSVALGGAGNPSRSGGGSAILRLDRPIAAAPGDRIVLRRESPPGTVAGGRVIDPEPARGVARRRTTPARIEALAAAPPLSAEWRAARLDLHGALAGPPSAIAADLTAAIDDRLTAEVASRPGLGVAELVRSGAAELRRQVGSLGSSRASGPGPAERIVAERVKALVAVGRLARDGERVTSPGSTSDGPSAELVAAMDRLVAALSVTTPPPLADAATVARCPTDGIRLLERADRIVRIDDDLAWAVPTYRDLTERAVRMAADRPLTPATYRDATGSSRKYVMAILEDLDRRAILRRTPDGHVPGPRAGAAIGAKPEPEPEPESVR